MGVDTLCNTELDRPLDASWRGVWTVRILPRHEHLPYSRDCVYSFPHLTRLIHIRSVC